MRIDRDRERNVDKTVKAFAEIDNQFKKSKQLLKFARDLSVRFTASGRSLESKGDLL